MTSEISLHYFVRRIFAKKNFYGTDGLCEIPEMPPIQG